MPRHYVIHCEAPSDNLPTLPTGATGTTMRVMMKGS